MKNNRRLVLSWIIAMGLVGFGVLANWYLVYVIAACLPNRQAQPLTESVQPPVRENLKLLNPYQQLYEELLYPSVRIETEHGIGSGVMITSTDKTTYIITAAHVVGNEALVTVELFNSAETLPAFVIVTDTGKDLALLNLITDKPYPYAAKLAPRNYVPYIFTPVWVIGCSLGYAPRPTEGTITSLSDLRDSVVKYWEMNAPIWPGNSGGGVFLKDTHELIGLAVWVKVYHGQLASTMGGIVPLPDIYEFLESPLIRGDKGVCYTPPTPLDRGE
jgi:S1-C subfamily serine protease